MGKHDAHTDCDTGEGTVLRVVKWDKVFETWESRNHRQLRWISLPTGNHSSGYIHLIDTFGDRAAAIYGAWIALVKIAATAPIRGVLANGKGMPYTSGHLSRLSYFPSQLFDELIAWATSPEVRWLEPVEVADLIRDGPEESHPAQQPGTDQVEHNVQPGTDLVESSAQPGSDGAPTGPTRQDQTRHNQTQHDQTRQDHTKAGLSVGLSVVMDKLVGLSVDDAERLCERFRRISRVTRSVLPSGILIAVCCCDAAVRRGFAIELAERLRNGSIRRPKQYVRSAIRKACEESNVDVDQFREAVHRWTAENIPTHQGAEQ